MTFEVSARDSNNVFASHGTFVAGLDYVRTETSSSGEISDVPWPGVVRLAWLNNESSRGISLI